MAEPSTQSLSRAKVKDAPTSEIGSVLNATFAPGNMAAWGKFVDTNEYVPELMWPKSVEVFNRMATDTQLGALFAGTCLPIRRFNWQLDPNSAPDQIVQMLAADINLPIAGEDSGKQVKKRYKGRFSFEEHLRLALYAGKFGHYFFEQSGEIGDDGYWHLKKLSERPPKTIDQILVAPDGGLISIRQNLAGLSTQARAWHMQPEIPVDRLVCYVWEKEGGDWTGKSWFRDCYKNWLVKDRLIRIDAINHERAGGIPIGVAPQGSTPTEQRKIAEMARGLRVSVDSGDSLPPGSSITQIRATGSDVVESMRYHDEAMARRFLLMVMQLGQTKTGSRALGTTFVDFFSQGLAAIADWYCDVFNEHVIEDYVDWNWEGVEVVPRLRYDFDPELAVKDLVDLVTAKVILVDDELETEVRREMGLPLAGQPRIDPATQAQLDVEQQMADTSQQQADTAKKSAENPPPPAGGMPAQPPKAKAAQRAGSARGAPSQHPARATTEEA